MKLFHFRKFCWLSWKTISYSHDRFTLCLNTLYPKLH